MKPLRNSANSPPRQVALAAVVVAGVITGALLVDSRLDAAQLIDGGLPGDLRRGLGLCEVFGHGVGVALILGGLFLTVARARQSWLRLVACAYLPGLVVNLVKSVVVRARPGACDQVWLDGQSGWIGAFPGWFEWCAANWDSAYQSFPSGHTATAFGLAVGLGWLAPRGRWYFLWVASLVATQRVVFAAHWPSDVAAGAAIGWLTASLLTRPGPIARWCDRRETGDRGVPSEPALVGPSARTRAA